MDTPIRLPRRHFLGAVLAGGAAAGLGQGLLGQGLLAQGVLAQALRAPSQAGPEGSGFDAADFGFRADGTAAANMQAVTAALTAAAGRPVTVTAAADFLMDRVQIPPGLAVDLRFAGPGRLDKRDGGGALTGGNDYVALQPIRTFDMGGAKIDGTQNMLPRLTVPDSTAYARGDVVRIVSDDVDPEADSDPVRFIGECAIVAATAPGAIYLAGPLEDAGRYLTNPRIGRLPRVAFSLQGLRIISDLSSKAVLANLWGLIGARIEMTAENHGRIVLGLGGCVGCDVHLDASGKGDGSGSLGYGVNETAGWGNHVIAPRGRFLRHLVTTNFPSATGNEGKLRYYGATRDLLVTDGIAWSSQGTPFDTHPGCRRTRFVNCASHGALRNKSSASCAVQIRGQDVTVEGLYADASHVAAIRFSANAAGIATIRGLRAQCPAFELSPNSRETGVRLSDIWLIDADVSVENAPSVLEDLGSAVSIHVQGGRLAMTAPATDYAQILSARGQGIWDLDDVEMVFGPGPARDLRFIRAADMAQVTGHAAMRITGKAAVRYVWLADGGTPVLMMKALWRQGPRPAPPLGGSWQQAYYAISDLTDLAGGATNVPDFATWSRTLGTLD